MFPEYLVSAEADALTHPPIIIPRPVKVLASVASIIGNLYACTICKIKTILIYTMKTSVTNFLFLAMLFSAFVLNDAMAQKAISLPIDYAKISLESLPDGAKVYCDGKLICTSTPATVEIPYRGLIMPGKKKDLEARLRRSAEASKITLKFVKEGYVSGIETITPVITSSGKDKYEFEWPKQVVHEMRASQQSAYKADPTIPVGEAKKRVTRSSAGKTSLERTIIRWYFDSAPQGARVFWRVISSVPDEVKNTNELWLGNTPFEETRSFNIQGLTYENSRDVQIEVKVKRKGYMDQTKRFNVRQAIDQQEISSFFDLVEDDTEQE